MQPSVAKRTNQHERGPAVRELPLAKLVEEFGGVPAWWAKRRPELVEAGVLFKVGKRFFGSVEAVSAWLMTRRAS